MRPEQPPIESTKLSGFTACSEQLRTGWVAEVQHWHALCLVVAWLLILPNERVWRTWRGKERCNPSFRDSGAGITRNVAGTV